MAGKTIDDLEEFSRPINEQLRDGSTTPDKLVVPARINTGGGAVSRTVQITLDNPLMLPELPQHGDSFDEYYGGSALRTDGADRHWAPVRVIFAMPVISGSLAQVGSRESTGTFYLYYPRGGGAKLEDYTDFCILYSGGWGTDLSPWFSLDAARGEDRDLENNVISDGGDQGYFFFNDGPRLRVHAPGEGINPDPNRACISVDRRANSSIQAILVR